MSTIFGIARLLPNATTATRRAGGIARKWEIEGVTLSTPALQVMDALGITTLAQLAAIPAKDLAKVKGCGRGTIKEIATALAGPRRSLRERRAEWAADERTINRSRAGCDCPNYVDGRRTRANERCNGTWIRCNGALAARNEALSALGPEPVR